MKGSYLIYFVAAMVILVIVALVTTFLSQEALELEGDKKILNQTYLAIPVLTEAKPLSSDATGNLPWAEKIINPDLADPYYVSEISCDVAKDVFNDFTKWGEQRAGLEYLTSADAFKEPSSRTLCEYSPDEKRYICLVGFGKFYLDQKNLGADNSVERGRLQSAGCWRNRDSSTGCTWSNAGNGEEYKLDEVCVNEVFNQLDFGGTSFCTDGDTEYLRISVGDQRLKFGNWKDVADEGTAHYGCYWNPLNTQTPQEPWAAPANQWKYACSKLCTADGILFGTSGCTCIVGSPPHPVTTSDGKSTCESQANCWWGEPWKTERYRLYDRIYSWLVDDRSYANDRYYVSDNWLKIDGLGDWQFYEPASGSSQQIRQDRRLYFYNVLWWDDDYGHSASRYEVLIPRVYDQQIVAGSWSKDTLKNFIKGKFDNPATPDPEYGTENNRFTIGGKKWPEMRTIYDGIIVLSETTSRTELQQALGEINERVGKYSCANVGDCLDYNLETDVWEERLEAVGTTVRRNENPINLRVFHPTESETLPAGKYRLIIRNWFSGLWYEEVLRDQRSCYRCVYIWCLNDRAGPGEKIRFSGFENCEPYETEIARVSGGTKVVESRYVDKTVILIKMKECSDSDGDVCPSLSIYNYGEAKVDGTTEVDTCSGSSLSERCCNRIGEESIGTNTVSCTYGCGGTHNGVCYSCSDTDAGNSPYTAGTATISGDGVTVNTQSDSCADATTLNEKYCDPGSGTIATASQACFWGCSSGVCGNPGKWPDNDAWTEQVTQTNVYRVDTNDGIGFWHTIYANPPITPYNFNVNIEGTDRIAGSQSIKTNETGWFFLPRSFQFFIFKDLRNLSGCIGVHFYHKNTGDTGVINLIDINNRYAQVTYSATVGSWQERVYKFSDFTVQSGFDWSKITNIIFYNNALDDILIDDLYFFKSDNSCGSVSNTCDSRCFFNTEYRGGSYSSGTCSYTAAQNCRFGCENNYECRRGKNCPLVNCNAISQPPLCSGGCDDPSVGGFCQREDLSDPSSGRTNRLQLGMVGCLALDSGWWVENPICCRYDDLLTSVCSDTDSCTYGSLAGCNGLTCPP